MEILYLAAFTLVLAALFHRWGARGAAALPLACILVQAAIGTHRTFQPHEDEFGSMRQEWAPDPLYHWGCHSVGLLPVFLLLGAAGSILLHLRRRDEITFPQRLGVAAIAMVLAAVPAVFVLLWWVVGFLGCDTL